MKTRHSLLGALGILLACSSGCSDAPERIDSTSQAVVGVVFKWSAITSQHLELLAPRNGGSALGATREDVISFSTLGAQTVVFDGTTSGNRRPLVREGTEGFAVPRASTLDVHDAAGVKKGSVPLAKLEYARLIPGSLQTFVPAVEPIGVEDARVTNGRILSQTGAQLASFTADDLVRSRTTAGHVLWSTRSALKKTTLAGASVWSIATWARKFETSANARYTIVNRGDASKVVDLYDEKIKKGTSTFPSAVWNVAMAPAGVWAVANDKTQARLFKNGVLHATIQLGTTVHPVAIDVSDLGYVLVSVNNPALANATVSLYDSANIKRFTVTLYVEEMHAFRPEPRFTPDGLGFFIREKSKLSFYGLVNP